MDPHFIPWLLNPLKVGTRMQDPIKILIIKPPQNQGDKKPDTNYGLIAKNTSITTAEDLAEIIHSSETLILRTKPQATTLMEEFRIDVGSSPHALSKANIPTTTKLHMIDIEISKSLEYVEIITPGGETLYRELTNTNQQVPPVPTIPKLVTWLRKVLKVETKHFLVISRSWSAMTKGVDRYHAYVAFSEPITSDEFVHGLRLKIQGEQMYQGITAAGLYVEHHPWIDDDPLATKLSLEYHNSDDFEYHVPVVREGQPIGKRGWVSPAKHPSLNTNPPVRTFTKEDYDWVVSNRNGSKTFGSQDLNTLSEAKLMKQYGQLLLDSPVVSKNGEELYKSFGELPTSFKKNITCPIEGVAGGRVWVAGRIVHFFGLGFKIPIPEQLKFVKKDVPTTTRLDLTPYIEDLHNNISFLKAPPGKGKTWQVIHNIPHGLMTKYPKGIVYLVPVYTLLHDLKADYPQINVMFSKEEAARLGVDHKRWDEAYMEGGVNVMTYDKFAGENQDAYMDMAGILLACDEVHTILQVQEKNLQSVMKSNKLNKNRWYRRLFKDYKTLGLTVLMFTATALPEWFLLEDLQVIDVKFPIETRLHASRVPQHFKIYGELSSLTIMQDKSSINHMSELREGQGRRTQLNYSKHNEDKIDGPVDIFTTSSGLAGVSYTQEFNGALIYNNTSNNFGAIGLSQGALRIRNHGNDPHLAVMIANTHFRDEYKPPQDISWYYNIARWRAEGVGGQYNLELMNFFDLDPLLKQVIYYDENGELIIDEAAVIAYYIAQLEIAQRSNFELMAEYMEDFGIELVDDFSHHNDRSSAQLKALNDKSLAEVGLTKTSENFKQFRELVRSIATEDVLAYYLDVEEPIELGESIITIGKPEKMFQEVVKRHDDFGSIAVDGKKRELTEAANVRTKTDSGYHLRMKRHATAHALGYYESVDPYFKVGDVYNRSVVVKKMNASLPTLKPHSFEEDRILDHLNKFCIYDYDKTNGTLVILHMRLFEDEEILEPVNNWVVPKLIA